MVAPSRTWQGVGIFIGGAKVGVTELEARPDTVDIGRAWTLKSFSIGIDGNSGSNMKQNKSRVRTGDTTRETDEEVWRTIRYLDPDLLNQDPLAIIFGGVGVLMFLSAVVLWVMR